MSSTYTWDGVTDGLWTSASSWIKSGGGSGYPGQVAGDIAYFISSNAKRPGIISTPLQSFRIFSNNGNGNIRHSVDLSISDISSTNGGTIDISSTNSSVINNTGINLSINASGGSFLIRSSITGATASLTKNGTGNLTLTGTNTYNGGTTINAGTLQLGNNTSTGEVSGNITNNGSLVFNRSNTYSHNGLISGTGTVTQSGLGPVLITGASTYSGATTVNNGILSVNRNDTYSGTITILSGSTYDISGTTTATISGTITGTGGNLTKSGIGTATFSTANSKTYTGTTTLNNGALILGIADISSNTITFSGGRLEHTVSNTNFAKTISGSIDISTNTGVTLSYTNAVTSATSFTKNGAGTLNLTNSSNTYSGPTSINAGFLSLTRNDTYNGAITIGSGSTFDITTSTGCILGGSLSGVGTLTKSGSGNTTISGSNSHSVPISINVGLLAFNYNNNDTYPGNVSISSSSTFDINSTNTFNLSGVISGSGNLSKSNSGTARLTGNNTYTGNTTVNAGTLLFNYNNGITYPGTITNSSSLDISSTNTFTVSGKIFHNSGIITKSGSGTVTFSGTNNYTSSTNVNGGILVIGSADAIGSSGTISFGGGILRVFNTSDISTRFSNGASQQYNIDTNGLNVTFASSLTSSGGTFTKTGLGTLTLTGTNTYSGTTTINTGGGTLQIGSGGTSGSITSAVTNNSAIIFNRSDTLTYAGIISGTGTLTKTGIGTITLSGNNTYSGNTTINTGTLVFNYANGFIYTGTITNATGLDISSANTFDISGIISGTGTLAKSGTGTVRLTGNNDFSGITNINGGTLALTYANGSTYGGLVTMGANTIFNPDGSNNYTISGAISGTTGTLTKTGSGTVTLSGNNTYSSGSNINSGTLAIGSANGIGTVGTISFGGGVLRLFDTTNYSSRFSNSASQQYNIDTNGFNVIFDSSLTSIGGTFTKQGNGTLTLLGNNTYTGNTTISAGTLVLNRANGNAYTGIISNASALDISSGNTFTLSGDISGAGTLTKNGSGTVRLINDNTYNGLTTINNGTLQIGNGGDTGSIVGDISNNSILTFNRSPTTFSYSGNISGTGSLVKVGGSIMELSGNNSYTGGTTLSAGRIRLNSTNAIGTTGTINFGTGSLLFTNNNTNDYSSRLSNASGTTYKFDIPTGLTVTFASNFGNTGSSLQLNNLSGANGKLIITGTITEPSGVIISRGQLQIGNNTTTGEVTGNITNNGTLIFSRSNSYTYSGIIDGSGALTQSGSGTLTLTGNNTYTDNTTVNTGSLKLLNGSLTSNTNIQSGASLTGNGKITGKTTVFGTLDIGASPGIFTFTDLDLSATSNTLITIYGPSYELPNTHPTYPKDVSAIDHIYVTNLLTIDPSAQFTIIFDVPSDISLVQYTGGGAYTWTKVFEAKNTTYTLPLNVTYPAGATTNWWTFDLIDGSSNLGISDEITLTYWARIACLTENTKVLTPFGYIKVQELKEGDYVLTSDNRKVKIKKLLKTTIVGTNKTRPYIIPKNSIGINYPPEEIKLSGGHLIKYNDKWILPKISGIFEQDMTNRTIDYYHIKLENYETDNLVINGGAIVESMGDRTFTNIYKERMNNLMIFDKNLLENN